ncbi:MAG: response regulator transcription factor [Pseudomonadota bacterium]
MASAGALIIDDHFLFSAGMRELVLGLEEIEHADCFTNPEDALAAARDYAVSLIVTDFYIPGYNVADWIGQFHEAFDDVPVVVISSSISRADRATCLNAGAAAYFEKHQSPEDVLAGLGEILATMTYSGPTARPTPNNHDLTDRQVDILVELARGLTQKEIARAFTLSPETIKTHLSEIYRRLGVTGKGEAARWARENGFV